MKTQWLLVLFLAIFSPLVLGANFLDQKAVAIGQPVSDFQLNNLEGQSVGLADHRGKIVVIHFWSATCPFVVRYEERLQAIVNDYAAKDVVMLAIDSNSTETPEQIKKAAEEHKVNYPILLDPGNKIADQFGAVTTPHVYILDKEGVLVYEGPVDDEGWKEGNPVSRQYVREALDAMIEGKPVPTATEKTFGCTVKRAA